MARLLDELSDNENEKAFSEVSNSLHLLGIYYVTDTALSALQVSSHFIFT